MINLSLSWRFAFDELLRGYNAPVGGHPHRGRSVSEDISPNQKPV